jgi:hypothetical protein
MRVTPAPDGNQRTFHGGCDAPYTSYTYETVVLGHNSLGYTFGGLARTSWGPPEGAGRGDRLHPAPPTPPPPSPLKPQLSPPLLRPRLKQPAKARRAAGRGMRWGCPSRRRRSPCCPRDGARHVASAPVCDTSVNLVSHTGGVRSRWGS